ncbi:arylsulfotransferase family protein [Halorussus salilacus]|uniref:arylsulfotransferase family protein n=1 Tax=Halorussus salilacus TaxID=2953750 RepID=UPI00209F2FD6|nr:arylsulfotransferase family protein [Halorussus salilacus]USZ69386.1 arylsulfotransferase family protein [Halorussus salilacus]
MASRRTIRIALVAVVVLSALVLVAGYLGSPGDGLRQGDQSVEQAFRSGADEPVVEPRENVTVVATDSNAVVSDDGSGPRAQAELVAFDTDGSVLYHNDTHTRYWDVDPEPNTTHTVTYVFAHHLDESECSAETVCTRNGIERVNLSTGETERLYSRVTPGKHSTRWHDADRIDDDRFVVADIYRDRVYVANVTTGLTEWEWQAQEDFPLSGGGPFPDDWTHVNDVEVLDDGTIMASLRNQDQVVFLDPETGLQENRTLGEEDDYEVIYEQHNPDFVPESEGGPAVLVADSENGRVVEYEPEDPEAFRTGEEDVEWERTWRWSDARMQWPRDADRLPNGHTLITDSNGDRVFEIDDEGEVVWSADVGFPYEAERLGTGDESAGGPAASEADIPSRTADEVGEDAGPVGRVTAAVVGLLPPKVVNAVAYVLPSWVGTLELLALLAGVPALLGLGVAEWRWSGRSVEFRWPVRFRR